MALGPDLMRMDVTVRRARAQEGPAGGGDGGGDGDPAPQGDAEDPMAIGARDDDGAAVDGAVDEADVGGLAEAVNA